MSGRDVRAMFMIQCINMLRKYLTQDLGVLSRVDFVRFRSILRSAGIRMNTHWTPFPFLAIIPTRTKVIPGKAGTTISPLPPRCDAQRATS